MLVFSGVAPAGGAVDSPHHSFKTKHSVQNNLIAPCKSIRSFSFLPRPLGISLIVKRLAWSALFDFLYPPLHGCADALPLLIRGSEARLPPEREFPFR